MHVHAWHMHVQLWYMGSACKPIATRELHEDKLIEKCLFEIMIVTTHWS